VKIRGWIRSDFGSMMEIEKFSFREKWNPFKFGTILGSRTVRGWVVEEDQVGVVGFLIASNARDTITILNMGIHPEYRREGVGTVLINAMKNRLSQGMKTRIQANVEEELLPVHQFLRSNGFRANVEKKAKVYLFDYRKENRSPVNRIRKLMERADWGNGWGDSGYEN